jgi:hypothetical protein
VISLLLALGLLAQRGPVNPQAAVVTGQLQTREGAPASAVRVSAIVAPPPNVRPEEGIQYYEAPPPVSTAFSDAQGRFRLGNIPPGRYYIVAAAAGQGTYYPGTPDRDRATIVTLDRGSTTTIDFKLALALGGRVSGRLTPAPEPGAMESAVLSGIKLEEVLETPIRPDGTFEFGHLPPDTYLLNVAPTPPGMNSLAFKLGDQDVSSLQFTRPPTHVVSGRIVVERGPLPLARLAFSTDQTYVPADIKADGTFTVRLHPAHHQVELAGMPVGYTIASVRVGSADANTGFDVRDADIADVVVTVKAPRALPHVRGRVDAVANGSVTATSVRLTGPIVGALDAAVQKDGSFDFPAVTPGYYTLTVPQAPSLAPVIVVVDWNDASVQVGSTGR